MSLGLTSARCPPLPNASSTLFPHILKFRAVRRFRAVQRFHLSVVGAQGLNIRQSVLMSTVAYSYLDTR
jgi:hypothetical protein